MFTLTTGSFHHLENALLNDLHAARSTDSWSSLLVISPSGHQLTRLQSEYAKRHSVLLNTHFLSFYAAAERVMVDSDYRDPVVTEPAFFSEMIHQILTGPSPEPVDLSIRRALGVNRPTVPQGLTGALAATLKDMRDSGMRAADALHAAQQGFLGAEAPEAAPTLALYARVVGLLEICGLRTSADLLRRASQRVPTHPWIQKQKAIFLYGFYDLTGAQLDFVLSLASHANARLYCPYEKNQSDFVYAERLVNDPAFLAKIKTTSTNDQPPKANRITTTVSVSGARDEVWWVAKEILRLTDEGVLMQDILVVARQLPPYLAVLRDVFSTHHIPMTLSRGENAGAHPLIKAIRSLLMIEEDQTVGLLRREELRQSPYIRTPALEGRLSFDPGMTASWTDHISWAKEELDAVILLPDLSTPEERALMDEVIASLEALSILDALGQPATRKHFLDTWDEKLVRIERPSGGRASNGVQVLEVQQARGLQCRVLFLLGMNEKQFPRLIREDPFLSDAARSALAQTLGCRLGRKLDGYAEERMLFALMRQTSTERLYLLCQRSDEEGKARIPSTYLRSIDPLVPGAAPERLSRALATKIETQSPMIWTPKELSYLINRVHGDPSAAYRALHWNTEEFHRLLIAHRAVESFIPGLGPRDAQIENVSAKKAILDRGFSPSSLEEIAECPFQFYASHVLKITPPDDLAPRGEITDTALGQLFHRTLELFYSRTGEPGAPQLDPTSLAPLISEAIDRCFEELTLALSAVYPLALRACKAFIHKHLLVFLKADIEEAQVSGFRPMWFEQSMAGLIDEMGNSSIRFQGKADRIDVRGHEGRSEIRVVDYKSGKPRINTSKVDTQVIQGKLLQLPIYLGLAAAFARDRLGPSATASEAAFRPIRQTEDSDANPRRLTTAFWKSQSAPLFTQNIRKLVELIEKGSFYIEPNTGPWGYCHRCHFARVCRKEHMPTRFRSAHAPVRQEIQELLGRTAPKEESTTAKTSKTKTKRDIPI